MGQLMGRMGPGSMGQWVMGLGYDGSDGSWVTNGDPWSTLIASDMRADFWTKSPQQKLSDIVPKG